MAKKAIHEGGAGKTDRLRALRLAREEERRAAGTWGDMSVGEIQHHASRSVFMQVWKGQRRPDPFQDGGAHRASASTAVWAATLAWVQERNSPEFSQRILAWDVNAAEARKVLEARIAELVAAGYTVTNPADAAK